MFEVSVLASGSSGNCYYIGSDKVNILIDAGISAKQISDRLKQIKKNIVDIDAIFVTHEHIDHIRGLDVLSRKYKIPVYMNKGTNKSSYLDFKPRIIETNQVLMFYGLTILPFSKVHDAAEPVSYLIKNGSKAVSVITDVGFTCENVKKNIAKSDLVILECNHDLEMLKKGSYPYYLKKRISSEKGHLSNYDAGLLVLEHASKKLKHVFLAHLSLNNNTPELALHTFNSIISERKDFSPKTWMTYKNKPTEIVRVS